MIPTSLITFLSFVLELCSASPVYNMQPAFITTHIGTTGRNIRNLPCVSRKTNEKGICMFAINCLKANGTHLGTCIDKFYFGSCCHIPPVSDVENTIDSDIIPSREPPHRLSTLKPVLTTLAHSSTTSTNTELSTIKKEAIGLSTSTTQRPTTIPTKEEKTTTESKISTTFKVQNFTRLPSIAESRPDVEITTTPQKLTTFMSINGSPSTTSKFDETTEKASSSPTPLTKLTTRFSTKKPKPTLSINSSTVKSTTKKTITKITTKPTAKPSKATSRPKPTTTSSKPVKTSKPTKKPVVTVKVTTRKPSVTTKITKTPPTVTKKPTTTTTVKVTTRKTSLTTTESSTSYHNSTTAPLSTSTVAETLISNEKLGDSTTPPKPTIAVTSEKLSTSTTTSEKPSLITWTVDDSRRNTTEEDNFINSTTEDWRPITTPDGWVLLPSVSSAGASVSTSQDVSVTTASPKDKFTTTTYEENISVTQKPEMNLTTQSPPSSEPTNSTSTSYSTETITTSEMQYTSSVSINNPMTTLLPESNGTSSSTTTETSEVIMSPVNMSDFTNVCGRRMYPEARIVGGEKSSFGKWPWQISLRQWRTSTYLHKCGAALLNENWAITAAHCVDNVPPSDLLLRLGEHDLSTESEPYLHQERRVQIVASHPQFDPRTFEYDLALLRFYEPVTFQPNIIPVCVPQSDENFVGRTAYVTGWGRLYEDGPLPSVLQEVSVPVINNSVCESMYRSAGYIEHIPHIFICAGWRRGGYDSCEGDSGGPMVIQREDKRFLLAGVISWGIGCAEPNQPGVYTRISEFRDWINQILQF